MNVLDSIPPDLKAPVEDLFLNDIEATANSISKSTKVIGMSYSPKQDNFNFSQYKELAEVAQKKDPYSKRQIPSIIPQIFDLNGFLSPYITQGNLANCRNKECISRQLSEIQQELAPLPSERTATET